MNVNIKAFDKLTDKELPNYIKSLETSDSLFMVVYNKVSEKETKEDVCCLNISANAMAHTLVSLLKTQPEIVVYMNTISQLELIREMHKANLLDMIKEKDIGVE